MRFILNLLRMFQSIPIRYFFLLKLVRENCYRANKHFLSVRHTLTYLILFRIVLRVMSSELEKV